MDASEETIGERLQRLRLERGLSQRAISSPGVSYAYISRVERGERIPSVKALRLLAAKLGVSVEHLEFGEDTGAEAIRQQELLMMFGSMSYSQLGVLWHQAVENWESRIERLA